ncbi:MAG: MBL fold metallo-hydrolase [Pseudomonadota bacterium]
MKPQVQAFFDDASNTLSYVVFDDTNKHCAVIDSVLDYDFASGRTATSSADAVIAFIEAKNLSVTWILETHVHADHLSAAPYIKEKVGGVIGISEHIAKVQHTFGQVFHTGPDFAADGSQFDHLFVDEETFRIGDIESRVIHTPGHTPACVTYVIGDAAFVGDTLFMPDYGTARTDFPGGDANVLYQSIQRLFTLPPNTRLFMCHDYKAPGRDEYRWETTVADERARNIHVHDGISETEFVAFRTDRDASLAVPKLLIPAVQINMCAGYLPSPEDNGISYLKIPLNLL